MSIFLRFKQEYNYKFISDKNGYYGWAGTLGKFTFWSEQVRAIITTFAHHSVMFGDVIILSRDQILIFFHIAMNFWLYRFSFVSFQAAVQYVQELNLEDMLSSHQKPEVSF
jgi:hypothetical protein